MRLVNHRLFVSWVISDALPGTAVAAPILAYTGSSADRRKAMRADIRLILKTIREHGFGTSLANGKNADCCMQGHVVGRSREPF